MGSNISRVKASAKRKKDMARANIDYYFEQARLRFAKEPGLAHRYMVMARKMALRFRLSVQTDLRWRVCKVCTHYLVPGKNARVRVDKGMRVILCKDCRSISRFRYKR